MTDLGKYFWFVESLKKSARANRMEGKERRAHSRVTILNVLSHCIDAFTVPTTVKRGTIDRSGRKLRNPSCCVNAAQGLSDHGVDESAIRRRMGSNSLWEWRTYEGRMKAWWKDEKMKTKRLGMKKMLRVTAKTFFSVRCTKQECDK